MDTSLFLALPRLHAEWLPPLQNCLTLWPGLPGKPDSAWAPELPLSPALSAACLADYERMCRDGASGSPVTTLGAEPAPADLSEAERRALREMAGLPVEEPAQPLRRTAQQVLLLTWLQEKQALDMAELERKISVSRQKIAGLISGTEGRSRRASLPGDSDLPDWKKTLAAALAFVPDMPESVVIAVSSPAMRAEIASMEASEAELSDIPAGYRAVRLPVSAVAALCGRAAHDRLKSALSSDLWQRELTFCLPASGD